MPLLDDHSRPYQYIAIRTDISIQKGVERALSDARQRELDTGLTIQQSLLLGDSPRVAQLEIATFTQPSQGVDGDFYEFFAHGNICDVLIGDVMGKGVNAALMGAGIKSHYGRALSSILADSMSSDEFPLPHAIINRLHQQLTTELIGLGAFVTIAYCRINLRSGSLAYIGGGHPPAILITGSGESSLLSGSNIPIGISQDENYTETGHPFNSGDLLFMYSDGVTEARNGAGEEFGVERLISELAKLRMIGVPPALLVQCVRRAVLQFTGNPEWSDDFTTIAIWRNGARRDFNYEEFARDLNELRRLREWVGTCCATFLPDDCKQRLIFAAVEIASNIIRHADVPVRGAAFLCHYEVSPTEVRLDFYYLGTPYDRSKVAPPDFSGATEGGFGLYIIEQSVDKFSQREIADQVNLLTLTMSRNV